jgi:hypothetical protein
MNFQELTNAADKAQVLCGIALDERRRVEWALVKHDNHGHRELAKSLTHLYFDLNDMYVGLERISRKTANESRSYEDWFYPDQTDLNMEETHERLIEFLRLMLRLHSYLRDIFTTLETIGAKEEYLRKLNAHLWLTLHFFRADIKTVTGQDL